MYYSTILLAGGGGTRFRGQNQEYKAFVLFKKVPFFIRVLKQIPSSAYDIIIVTIKNFAPKVLQLIEQYQFYPKPRLAFDELQFQDPMSGIISGMQAAHHDGCLTVPCDISLLRTGVLQELMTKFEQTNNVSTVIPKWPNGYIEPLTAIYRKSLVLKLCRSLFDQGERRLSKTLDALENVRYVDIEQFRKVDPELDSFVNINTENEFLKLEALHGQPQVSE